MSESSERPGRGRDRPWVMRTYAGHSSAAASNALYRRNLDKGQTGLSVAFDLPTQTGYDPDHPLARGEVGKVGVPVSHLGDVQALFADIPLSRMNTSMTINATAMWLLALYRVAPRSRPWRRARTRPRRCGRWPARPRTTSSRSTSRGTYVFAPGRPAPDHRHGRLHRRRDAALEPHQHLQLPPAGGRRDAGAGDRLRDAPRSRCWMPCATPARCRRPASARSWPASRSSSTPGCASSRRCARCAPSSSSGTS